jgi:two-component sensor histidine kinase
LDEVLVNILEEVRPLLGVVGASIWLNDDQTGELVCHQASGVHNEMLRGWRLQPGEGIAGWVAQHGQSQIVPDVQADARHFKNIEQEIGLELHSILCVPLQSKLTVIGVLEVVDTTADRFNQTDLTLVESLAATATIAIENARLYEQTRGDAKISAVLLEEVNHRVKNNLAAIIGLLHLEQRHLEEESQTIDQTIMQDLINRIHGLATAHRLLSTANWSPILLSELTTKVIHSALQALPLDKYVSVEVSPSSIQIVPKLANTLALVITELTTNTVKYAWPKAKTGHIAVRLDAKDDYVLLEFRDDGPGFPEEVLRLERHSVGWELIQTLVRHGLRGEITLHNDQGAVTTIRFPPFI